MWASVFTRRAWDEREWARIDHDAVGMAVLVQPFLSNLRAIGVAITENPFSERRSGILVNLAPAGESVTDGPGDLLPEQILLYRHSSPEVLSRDARVAAGFLLPRDRLQPLRVLLDRVHAHFVGRWPDPADDAVDVELAIRRDGAPVLLQARPYRMRRGSGAPVPQPSDATGTSTSESGVSDPASLR